MVAAERQRNRRAVLDPETLGGRPDERLLDQQLESPQARMIGHEREFERAGGNLRGELRRTLAGDRHLDQRMAAGEPAENLGEERFGVVVRDAEPHRAAQALARQGGHGAGLDLDDPAGEVDQAFALGGEPHAAALFDEQGAAELLLEPADMHRHGRLGLVDALGRLGERARIHDGEERAQLVGVEHGDPSDFMIDNFTNIRWTDQ